MRLFAALAVLSMNSFGQPSPVPSDSMNWLNQGVKAFKTGQYKEAAADFQKAVDLDPNNVTPRLYLGTTFMTQFIPGAEGVENAANASRAKAEFLQVLQLDPNNVTALTSLASLSYSDAQGTKFPEKTAKLDEAASWYQKLAGINPNNKEGYYSMGVIVWAKFYPALQAARKQLGMAPEAPGPLTSEP